MILAASSFKAGDRVLYRPFPGLDHREPAQVSYVSGDFVYVIFDSHRKAFRKAAQAFCCRPEDLEVVK